MLKLHIQDEEGKTTVVPLVRDEVTIGRQEGNTIRLTEKNVSRKHARLRRSSGSVVLEEVSARYGTRLNGAKIDGSKPIKPGDVIQIGDYRLALHTEDQPVASGGAINNAATQQVPVPMSLDAARTGVGRAADGSTSIIDIAALGESLDDDTRREIPKADQARIVTTSNNVQRREFWIDHTPCVIGRTDENDIPVDHRSISRHHARIIWNGSMYTILDLESANGVKVNGDFYKRADLNNGDDVELGHVMVKFIGAGQPIPAGLPRDIPVGKPVASGAGRWVTIGLGVAAVGIAIAWFVHWNTPTEPENKLSNVAQAPAVAPPTPEVVPPEVAPPAPEPVEKVPSEPIEKAEPSEPVRPAIPPSPEIEAKPPEAVVEKPVENPVVENPLKPAEKTPREQAEAIIEAAQKKVEAGEFADAKSLLNEALKIDPTAKGVEDIMLRLTVETKGQEKLAEAGEAITKKDWMGALQASREGLQEAPKSKAAEGLRDVLDRATLELCNESVASGDRYMKEKFFRQALTAYKKGLTHLPTDERAKRGVAKAQAALGKEAEKPTEKPVVGEKPVEKPTEKPTEKPVEAAGGSKLDQAKALADQAKAAKRANNLPLAEKLYKECLQTHAGMSSCRAELAVILMARGQRCDAIDHMRKYVRAAPGSAQAVQFQRVIEQFEPQCQ